MTPVRIDVESMAEALPRISKLLEGVGGKVEAVDRIPKGLVYAQCSLRWEDLPRVLLGLASILDEPHELPIVEEDRIHTAFVKKTESGVPMSLLRIHRTPFTPESTSVYVPLEVWEWGDLVQLFHEVLSMMPEFESVGNVSVHGDDHLHITGSVEVRDGYVLRDMGRSRLELNAEVIVGGYVEINFLQLVLTSGDEKAYILHFKPYPDADDWDKGAPRGGRKDKAPPAGEGIAAQRLSHYPGW
ncbi:hypothetical protein [Palaeococcus ferrophilus]|uniref:hypothetical protein n=1 Tax=Palaeococcus ferrophilus TaxID=83868 RepID=UPI00064E5C69|nr:hypothetical protein [Palaeococcus ferrophilus]